MADGTFAVILAILSYGDLKGPDCGAQEFCLPPKTYESARLSIAAGPVVPRIAEDGTEIYLRYDPAIRYGSIGTAFGLSVGNEGEIWAGAGVTYDVWINSKTFAQLHFMPGGHMPGDGFDLGGPIAFRSGIELGFETTQGWRIGISYDHMSNGFLYSRNPGIETVQLRVSLPLGPSTSNLSRGGGVE